MSQVVMPRTQLIVPGRRRPLTRFMRGVRALWRDTSALWSEFHRPILAVLIATFGGGWLYGELYWLARGERIPFVDLPYYMIQLMSLQGIPEEKPPQELYLVAFWYILPLVAIYVIGRGAVDFGRLFFDRTGRRSQWEEALASTYRNHIIVLGIGHVGLRIIRQLCAMGFDIVALDMKVSPEQEAELSELDVPCVFGDGRLPATLEKAGLLHARAIIVCTADDQTNLEITMRVRDLNPDVRIVVRMWDNTFARQLNRFMGVEAVLSASDLAAPAFAGAAVGIEVTQTIKVHGIDYSMIRLQVEPGSFMDGVTVGDLQRQNNMDVVLYAREGEADVHPDQHIRVQGGDTLVIFARHAQITDLVARKQGKQRGQ
ncbi:MAG: TrkA family potassium uptake protein [Chloroflexota bacterium]|nr:TrkA family potassium uptake protein [Chloroflexota bacterium]